MALTGQISDIPYLGSGLGFRRELRHELFAARAAIDFVEIITEQYTEDPRQMAELEELCDVFRVIPHGISLSIGTAGPLDMDYLKRVKRVSDATRTPYYSEHLCMTRAPGIEIGHLSPLWFTREVLDNVIERVNRVQDYLEKPLILENVTYLFEIPNATLSQGEFFHRLVDATGCGVLLDVTNVFINSLNHGYDPIESLDQMPLDRVVQIHLAGGFWSDDVFIDGHCEEVQEESWNLLERLTERTFVRGSILEHDSNFPEVEKLLNTVRRARAILERQDLFTASASPGMAGAQCETTALASAGRA